MENIEENIIEEKEKTSFAGSSLTHGLLTGVGLILLTLLIYLLDLMAIQWLSYLSYAILIAGIIYGTIQFRNEQSGGYISYGRALGYGTLVSVFAACISGLFVYLFYAVIAPDAMEQLKTLAAEKIIETNPEITDEQLDMVLRFTNPVLMFISTIFSLSFIGFVFSLVTAAFLKRKDPEEF